MLSTQRLRGLLPPFHLVCLFVLASLLASATARGHQFETTDTRLDIVPPTEEPGSFVVDMTVDLDALALGVPASTDDQLLFDRLESLPLTERAEVRDRLINYLERRLRVYVDDEQTPFEVSLPEEETSSGSVPSWFGTRARLAGALVPGASTIRFRTSRSFPAPKLLVTSFDTLIFEGLLERGATSPSISLHELPAAPKGSRIARYIRIGFEHILPAGLDHILFVLGLVLARPTWQALLTQVTAFTVAHSLTLVLATTLRQQLAGVEAIGSWVEIAIAASIVYIAVENLRSGGNPPQKRRLAVVFGFGLLHGLGFAGALRELLSSDSGWLAALFGFNVGVEVGQLVVVAIALGVLALLSASLAVRVGRIGSVAIGIVGLVWTYERLVGLF